MNPYSTPPLSLPIQRICCISATLTWRIFSYVCDNSRKQKSFYQLSSQVQEASTSQVNGSRCFITFFIISTPNFLLSSYYCQLLFPGQPHSCKQLNSVFNRNDVSSVSPAALSVTWCARAPFVFAKPLYAADCILQPTLPRIIFKVM